MHHVYTTKAIILKRVPQDASAYYYLLTKDLGLIRARAQGVRQVQSRLKGALQEFSLSTVAFVHGKSGWKITTAIPERNFYADTKNVEVQKIIAHISDSLIRLITGEEKNQNIFDAVSYGFSACITHPQNASAIESIILVRILHSLGLISSNDPIAPLLTNFSDFSPSLLSHTTAHKAFIIRAINRGFQESQL